MTEAAPARPSRPASFRSVLADREFRWVWVAGMQSLLGDQIARVALSVLVYARTGSGLATAGTYALTFLPALVGGLLLGTLADRCPRRELLIGCDLLRAVLLAPMAVAAVPLPVLVTLLALAVFIGSPFKAAEPALVADLFTGDRYTAAIGLRTATGQTAQLAGFAVGGAAVAAIGSRPALAVDAITFLVSAALLRLGLRFRSAAAQPGDGPRGMARVVAGAHVVARSARLRVLLGLSWLASLWVVPEGLAVPYAAATGGGAAAAGLLLAAAPAGTVVGAVLLSRWVPPRWRAPLVGPLAVASGIPLAVCVLRPGLGLTVVLWAVCGLFSAYQVQIVPEFVAAAPDQMRGQAIGLAAAGLLAGQGLGILAGGALAQAWAPAPAIAVAGVAGAVLAVPLALRRRAAAR